MKKFLIGIVSLVAMVILTSPAFGALASASVVFSDVDLGNSGIFMFDNVGNDSGNKGPSISQMESRINDWFQNDGSSYNYGPITDLLRFKLEDFTEKETASGSWTTPEPISFYSLKAGNGYAMFWVEKPSTTGTFSTYVNGLENYPDLNGKELSHITFYTANPVPIPAAAWLLGSGMLGLLVVRRRRNS